MSASTPYSPIIIQESTDTEWKHEINRLKSFKQWNYYDRASPILLAQAGFVFTGSDDVVKCFVCHIAKGDWKRQMNPLITHRQLNPNCIFCQGNDDLNVQIYVPEDREYQDILESLHRTYCASDTPSVSSNRLAHRSVDIPDSVSASDLSNARGTQTNFPVVATDAGTPETSRQAIGVRGALGQQYESEAPSSRQEYAPMKQESNRFNSYDSTWPRQDTPDPRDLARAGFYYTGTADRVQCAFCRGILRNWDEDDVPMDEHKRHFSSCPFVMGLDVGNIPDPTAIISANTTGNFLNVTEPATVVSDSVLGIVTERPKHSRYAVEAARIASFKNWPRGKAQTPEMLAKAGFFYAGFGDSVKCFYCDGGLRTWEPQDVPWIEHARWYPRCAYVRQVKGENFIAFAMEDRQDYAPLSTTESHSSQSTETQVSDSGCRVDPREITARMDSSLVQHVLTLDIPRHKVERAIRNRLQDTGDDFQSIEALMEAIFQLSDDPSFEAFSSHTGGLAGSQPLSMTGAKGGHSKEENEASSLLKENEQMKEERQCKICMNADVSVVFLPCGHLVCCTECAQSLHKCPICRSVIRGTVRTFMS